MSDISYNTDGSLKADFYGIWRNSKNAWMQYDIRADKIVYTDSANNSYTINDIIWTSIINNGSYSDFCNSETYPNGFCINGTFSNLNGLRGISGGAQLQVGSRPTIIFFINTDKTKIFTDDWSNDYNPFSKQQ
uniref:Uncharacterized protein n=1 Tax=uncultured bacterium contig00060 TaxID=1181543 RepID=A0A806K127_9BACT|nr:hypothetical protein [uncultured bacterium contig00060]